MDCFRQRTVLGVYRFILLSIIVYLLAHWAYLESGAKTLPDWGESAAIACKVLLPKLLLLNLIIEINQAKQLARKHGLDLSIRGWQYG